MVCYDNEQDGIVSCKLEMEEILKHDNKLFDKLLSLLSIALIASILTVVRRGNILENNIARNAFFKSWQHWIYYYFPNDDTFNLCH
jgi:hypothetical protein